MANMGYCRFRNTLQDLRDCYDHLHDEIEDNEEAKAHDQLISLCFRIIEETEDQIVFDHCEKLLGISPEDA